MTRYSPRHNNNNNNNNNDHLSPIPTPTAQFAASAAAAAAVHSDDDDQNMNMTNPKILEHSFALSATNSSFGEVNFLSTENRLADQSAIQPMGYGFESADDTLMMDETVMMDDVDQTVLLDESVSAAEVATDSQIASKMVDLFGESIMASTCVAARIFAACALMGGGGGGGAGFEQLHGLFKAFVWAEMSSIETTEIEVNR